MSKDLELPVEDLLEIQRLLDRASLNGDENNISTQRDTIPLENNSDEEARVQGGHQRDTLTNITAALAAPKHFDDDILSARVLDVSNGNVELEWYDMKSIDLNYTHQVVGTLTTHGNVDWSQVRISADDVLVNASISTLLNTYRLWQAGDLREIAHAHELHITVKDTCDSLLESLDEHLCGRACPAVIVIFRPLRKRRSQTQVQRRLDHYSKLPLAATHSYMQTASEDLRRAIIREWQTTFSTETFATAVCGPCGRRSHPTKIAAVSPALFDLSLLTNNALPIAVHPTTYAFEVYGRALLNPKGLADRWALGDVNMCETCRRDIVVKHRMPKLCLANWLYYAYDELPHTVKQAFKESTFTDRLLVSRARSSRISFRFSELKNKKDDIDNAEITDLPDHSSSRAAVSQKCVKGNVLVMPQDSTHLNTVLPPSTETIRDTVCAVFVGSSKPTKDTIGKVRPLLARKSRVSNIINFLISSNSHYICDTDFHGFSQRNLDSLFGPGTEGDDEGIPCAMDIGFIEDNEAIRAAVSDYSGRDAWEDDPSHDGEALLMDNVGYTMGDQSPLSYREMKMKALSHCLSCGRFVCSQVGDRFVPDFENPSLLTWLFPHLDPWGIGGFHEPSREVPISMEDQLKYLLELDDSPFVRDPDFAFVYYNILQKKSVCNSVRFKVKMTQQREIIHELLDVDKHELERLISRYKCNSSYQPQTDSEKRVVALVNRVGTILHDLPGTTGYKLKMRNEIRSLINLKGTPAFFITLNPSDVDHPLVRLLAGDDIRLEALEAGEELTRWQRLHIVARNPAACAKFFHTMISTFISVVLRYGRKDRGLLGKCTAYYATVETQGRGTLHCHMLVWLHGHPSPKKMRQMMVDSQQYQQDMFRWLESLIHCELIGTTMAVQERNGPLVPPTKALKKLDEYVHPGTHLGPRVDEIPPDKFPLHFASSVNDVVSTFNWHKHTETCWKYLKRGEERTDKNCRMRINGDTREATSIDEETGSILLRRLHPRIANYNDLIIFLIRANMDIKHVGSGEASQALIYYLTDYITKASLPTHVGLSALLYVINRTNKKYERIPNWAHTEQTGALTILVNSMMSRQEVSHQQVMSYLVGGGDHYSSDRYRILHYASFEKCVIRYWLREEALETAPPDNSDDSADEEDQATHTNESQTGEQLHRNYIEQPTDITSNVMETLSADDDIALFLGAGSISAVNQHQDYLLRPEVEPFDSMGLYEYIGMTEKVTKDRETRRIDRRQTVPSHALKGGRPEESRGQLLPTHPQYRTHIVRKRTVWVVPVVLGRRLPRPDRNDEEREEWARAVLTLFTPWRHPADLKMDDERWLEAYERKAQNIPPEHMAIIHNMNVLSECKDARDKATLMRKAAKHVNTRPTEIPVIDPFDVYERHQTHVGISDDTAFNGTVDCNNSLLKSLDSHLGLRFRHAIDTCFTRPRHANDDVNSLGSAQHITQERRMSLDAARATMRQLKRKRRPEELPEEMSGRDRSVRRRRDRPPLLDTMQLNPNTLQIPETQDDSVAWDAQDILYQIILEKNLMANPEQLRAFEIVGNHVIRGMSQLLMYIGGVGGTGKSHVVNSILRLFALLGKRKRILVAAPTGAAAILIGGHTIHSLTLLPDSPGRDLQELTHIWENIDYLILDEISMIGAKFLSQLNARIIRGKAVEDSLNDLPFGGVNVIFTGDFGQLRPIHDPPLYSHKLLKDPRIDSCCSTSSVSALVGASLWRQVKTVVILKINQRQAGDRQYAELLSRIRLGEARATNNNEITSDFHVLTSRYMDRINLAVQSTAATFTSAPVIVGRKKVRDLLNLRIMGHHANELGAEVHLYHSRDKIAGHAVADEESGQLWKLSSTATHDSLGKLPLFPGMKIMVQENLAFTNRVVNGTEGTIRDIIFEEENEKRYPVAVYVHIPGAGRISGMPEDDIVPIFPEFTTFPWFRAKDGIPYPVSVTRSQLPLLPSYAYTDYKSQGRSLTAAIIDPQSASSLQGVYVMLSRVRALEGLAILRPFKVNKLQQRLSQELREELKRLDALDEETRLLHAPANTL